MELQKFIVVGTDDGGYMIAKLLDAGENYYQQIVRGDRDKYFDISEMVFNANSNYDRHVAHEDDDLF